MLVPQHHLSTRQAKQCRQHCSRASIPLPLNISRSRGCVQPAQSLLAHAVLSIAPRSLQPAARPPQHQQRRSCVCRSNVPTADPSTTTLGFCGMGIMGVPMVGAKITAYHAWVTAASRATGTCSFRFQRTDSHKLTAYPQPYIHTFGSSATQRQTHAVQHMVQHRRVRQASWWLYHQHQLPAAEIKI